MKNDDYQLGHCPSKSFAESLLELHGVESPKVGRL